MAKPKGWQLNLLVNFCCLGLTSCLIIGWYGYFSWFDNYLEITFLDVGQGDAVLVKTPDGVRILIDSGKPGTGVEALKQELLPWEKIDIALVSHADADHMGSTVAVIQKYATRYLLLNNSAKQTQEVTELADYEGPPGFEKWQLYAGDSLKLGCCVYFHTLWPQQERPGNIVQSETEPTDETDTNYHSITNLLTYGHFRMLSGGDIPSRVEEQLTKSYQLEAIDLFKVSHHGSKTSSSKQFLQTIRPHVSVIQVGAGNTYGHPAPEVLESLASSGTLLYRSDIHGTISYRTDGFSYKLSTSK